MTSQATNEYLLDLQLTDLKLSAKMHSMISSFTLDVLMSNSETQKGN